MLLIALEPARSGIPTDDFALGAKHVDGVIHNGVDQQLVTVINGGQ
ncbi:hypothetical protein ALP35_01241 [Pseudomonas savastanoi pv. glycinea]|nr:hypothetical protein ALP35_01241 [Pseudomonas savastanoi pv. glycinea]